MCTTKCCICHSWIIDKTYHMIIFEQVAYCFPLLLAVHLYKLLASLLTSLNMRLFRIMYRYTSHRIRSKHKVHISFLFKLNLVLVLVLNEYCKQREMCQRLKRNSAVAIDPRSKHSKHNPNHVNSYIYNYKLIIFTWQLNFYTQQKLWIIEEATANCSWTKNKKQNKMKDMRVFVWSIKAINLYFIKLIRCVTEISRTLNYVHKSDWIDFELLYFQYFFFKNISAIWSFLISVTQRKIWKWIIQVHIFNKLMLTKFIYTYTYYIHTIYINQITQII